MFLDRIREALDKPKKPNWLGITRDKATRHPGSKKWSKKGKKKAAAKRARRSRKRNRR